MLKAADFRQIAREALRGNWLVAVGTGIIASLLGGCIMSSGAGNSRASADEQSVQQAVQSIEADPTLTTFLVSALVMVGIIALVYAVVTLVIGGAVSMGYAKYNLNLINRSNPKVDDLFSQMKRFKEGFVMQLFSFLFTFLWMLLFIVPGIIASYSYAMAPYILMENPGMTGRQAIAASKELMRGNKWRLFCLSYSFFGWHLLCGLTFGIGYLFLRPYIEAAGAAFYREIKWEKMKQQAGM